MKAIKIHLRIIAISLSMLMLLEGCTVYKSAPVTLDEVSKSNNKVRIKTLNNKSLKFDRIVVTTDNKIYGRSINKGEMNITPIDKDNIEKIQIKDKTMSTILSIAIPVIVSVGMLGIIVDQSLNNLNLGNVSN
jgi:hypothetical protein